MLIPLMVRLLHLRSEAGLRLLSRMESASAHCYHALSLSSSDDWDELAAISEKEFAHCRQLLLMLGEEPGSELLSRKSPNQREGWSIHNRYCVGLSSFRAWQLLFGPSLFEMPHSQALAVIGLIEGLHLRLYSELARGTQGAARRIFIDIANDELSHRLLLSSYQPIDWVAIRFWLLFPLGCLVFWLVDWPKVSKF
jgi:hypothetical protein